MSDLESDVLHVRSQKRGEKSGFERGSESVGPRDGGSTLKAPPPPRAQRQLTLTSYATLLMTPTTDLGLSQCYAKSEKKDLEKTRMVTGTLS